jgi:hypothetical protein
LVFPRFDLSVIGRSRRGLGVIAQPDQPITDEWIDHGIRAAQQFGQVIGTFGA